MIRPRPKSLSMERTQLPITPTLPVMYSGAKAASDTPSLGFKERFRILSRNVINRCFHGAMPVAAAKRMRKPERLIRMRSKEGSSYHHVVPRRDIIDVYNLAVKKRFACLSVELIEVFARLTPAQAANMESEALAKSLEWGLGLNLVEGPKPEMRQRDPGKAVDVLDPAIKFRERRIFIRKLEQIGQVMSRFLLAPDANRMRLSKLLDGAKSWPADLVNQTTLYNQVNWVESASGSIDAEKLQKVPLSALLVGPVKV